MLVDVKTVNFTVGVFSDETTVENNFTGGTNDGGVMRNFAEILATGLDGLPLDSQVRVLVHHVHLGQIYAPHRTHGTFFQVTTTVDVKAIKRKQNETLIQTSFTYIVRDPKRIPDLKNFS